MADITLYKNHTALLIADFYADQMSKLPHAVNRKCLEKTLALRQAARAAGVLICYSATVFRPGCHSAAASAGERTEGNQGFPP